MKKIAVFCLLTIFISITAEARDYDPSAFGHIVSIKYSHDGKYIAAAELGGLIRIYDSVMMEKASEFNVHRWGYFRMEFSPDNLYIALSTIEEGSGWPQEILLFEVKTGNMVFKLTDSNRHGGEIKSISYRFDGQRLVSGAGYTDGIITMWDTIKGIEIMKFNNNHRECIYNILYSPDGDKIISASTQNIKIWDANNGMELKTLYEKNDTDLILIETNVIYSQDNTKILASWGKREGGIIKIYDSDNYDLLYSYNIVAESIAFVTEISFVINSNFVIICYRERNDSGYFNKVDIIDYTDGTLKNSFKLPVPVAISPDGRSICYSENKTDIKILKVFSK
jgi:WD40 repeat protein